MKTRLYRQLTLSGSSAASGCGPHRTDRHLSARQRVDANVLARCSGAELSEVRLRYLSTEGAQIFCEADGNGSGPFANPAELLLAFKRGALVEIHIPAGVHAAGDAGTHRSTIARCRIVNVGFADDGYLIGLAFYAPGVSLRLTVERFLSRQRGENTSTPVSVSMPPAGCKLDTDRTQRNWRLAAS